MDLQQLLDNSVKAARADELKSSPQITLGEAIAVLENSELTYTTHDGKTEDKHVYFDFEYLFPSGLQSWRGIYAELAITFDGTDFHPWEEREKHQAPTAKDFLRWLKEAVGKTYEGYKGGDFTMGKTTPLWIANYSNSGETMLVAVEVNNYGVVLRTWAKPAYSD